MSSALFGTITAAVASWFVQHFEQDKAPTGEDLPARLDRLEASLARIEAALGREGLDGPAA